MIDHSIDERLHKLAEEFHRFVNGESLIVEKVETNPKEIASKFGLSLSQAKAWLKKESNYSSDESYHEPHNRRKVNRTEKSYCLNMKTLQQ
jgi:hypothetical protein